MSNNNNPFRGAGPSGSPRQLSKPTTTTTAAVMQCLVNWAAANLPLLEQNKLPQLRQAPRRLRKLPHPPPSLPTLPWHPPRHWPSCRPPPPGAVLSRYLTTSEASWLTRRPRLIMTVTKAMMTWGRLMRGNSGDTHLTLTWASCQTIQAPPPSPPSLAISTQLWAVSSGHPHPPPAPSRPRLSIKLATHTFLLRTRHPSQYVTLVLSRILCSASCLNDSRLQASECTQPDREWADNISSLFCLPPAPCSWRFCSCSLHVLFTFLCLQIAAERESLPVPLKTILKTPGRRKMSSNNRVEFLDNLQEKEIPGRHA